MGFRTMSNNLQFRRVKAQVISFKTPFWTCKICLYITLLQKTVSRHYINKGVSSIYNDNIAPISSDINPNAT